MQSDREGERVLFFYFLFFIFLDFFFKARDGLIEKGEGETLAGMKCVKAD